MKSDWSNCYSHGTNSVASRRVCASGSILPCCVGYAREFAIYYTVNVANRKPPVLLPGYSIQVMHVTLSCIVLTPIERRPTDDQYSHRQLSKNLSRHLRSVNSQVCLQNLQLSYSKLSRSSYFFQVSLSSPSSPIVKLCSF